METYNFKLQNYSYSVPNDYVGKFVDLRNGISCVNPTCDLECYLNYIELLNLNRDKWKGYGYLDMGMIPLIMAPSFLQNTMIVSLTPLFAKFKLKVIHMPPVSLMCTKCNLPAEDIWAFKDDVAKVFSMSPDKVTLSRILERCMK